MQRMVALSMGNIKTGHPLYKWITADAATSTPSVINMAANRLVRMIPHRLPELPAAWTIGPTIAGENSVSLVSDMIVVHSVSRAESSTEPDWDTAKTYPLGYVTPEEFDLLEKDDEEGYPSIWTKRGNELHYWPTPSADYIDYLRVHGVMEETALVNSSDEFYINAYWHPIICRLATSMLEEMRGNYDRSKALLESVMQEISDARDLAGEEAISKPVNIRVVGTPTRQSVYGK